MEKIAEAHGGGAVRGTWTDIDPTKYDEAHEVQGLELDPGYFISPYDVPDGVRLLFTANRGYLIELRCLTDQEKIEFTGTELPWIHFGLGRHPNRLVSLEVAATNQRAPRVGKGRFSALHPPYSRAVWKRGDVRR